MTMPTKQEALTALEDMDDFARMIVSVEPIGAYQVLKDFIEQAAKVEQEPVECKRLLEMVDTLLAHVNGAHLSKSKDWADANWQSADRVLENIQVAIHALYAAPPAPAAPEGWAATHLKTGNQYMVTGESIHAGNVPAVPGELMVEYQRDGKKYVRAAIEFQDRFAASPEPAK